MKNRPFWENNYEAKNSDYAFGKPSQEIIEIIPKLPINAKILDIGARDGRNSIFLAKNGFNVTAIDNSKSGIEKIKFKAKNLDIKLNTILEDIFQFDFKEKYDLIIASGILHLLPQNQYDIRHSAVAIFF